jgi:hypothetical protein
MKKLNLKKTLQVALLTGMVSVTLTQCKKDKVETPAGTPVVATTPVSYSSPADFFTKNGVQLQTYTINGTTGGTFTSPQGTIVTIPANAFITSGAVPVTGTVKIEFKDIYKMSDMLLSNMATQTATGPLKSGGEFFIKAVVDSVAVLLANGKKIKIEQPAMGLAIDPAMVPWVFNQDSAVWKPAAIPNFTVGAGTPNKEPMDSLTLSTQGYVYSLYKFNNPAASGTWCNSDNSGYFSAYPQTSLTIHPSDTTTATNTNVFLVFTGINSMVHVYQSYSSANFPYLYAPVGLQCTVVTLTIKNNKVYSSFTPITISTNQTVNYTVTETTTEAFKTKLNTLNL